MTLAFFGYEVVPGVGACLRYVPVAYDPIELPLTCRRYTDETSELRTQSLESPFLSEHIVLALGSMLWMHRLLACPLEESLHRAPWNWHQPTV